MLKLNTPSEVKASEENDTNTPGKLIHAIKQLFVCGDYIAKLLRLLTKNTDHSLFFFLLKDGDTDFELENDDFEYDTPSEDDGGDWRRPAKKKVNSSKPI